MTTLYTAHATSIAGREGTSKTDDGKLDLKLSKPGGDGQGTNPEQLFACGYSACFGGAIDAVAKSQGVNISEVKVQADVSLHKDDNAFSISVVINATLAGVDQPTAEKIVAAAHQVCPYSKATRGNIEVVLKVSGEELKAAA